MSEASPTILVFDSGLGGLTVLREVLKLRPDASYVYAADDAFFPYSGRGETELTQRVVEVMSNLIDTHQPDLAVIACNTASTLVLPSLRSTFEIPFVGTVPAIKPACASSKSRLVSVLGTGSTVAREYTQGLVRDFGEGCAVTLVGSDRLAVLAEAAFDGEAIDEDMLASEISPCFIEQDGQRTDVVVLACTHYPLLLDRMRRLAPWDVEWLDPAEAIARRVRDLLGAAPVAPAGSIRLSFTSGRRISASLQDALLALDIDAVTQ